MAAVECPLDRIAAITSIAVTRRTLPKSLSDLRLSSIREALDAKHTMTAIAERSEVSVGRVSQLAHRAFAIARPEGATA
jgi:hypothetical protein